MDAIGLPAEWEEPQAKRRIESGVDIFECGSIGDIAVQFKRQPSPAPNVAKTQAARFPVFDEQEIMLIKTAGDKLNVHAELIHPRIWNDSQYRKFKPLYDKWKEGQSLGGTQISDWPKATVSQKASLIHQNILTVEQFGAMPQEKVETLPSGIRELWTIAKTEIDAATAKPDITSYIDEIVELRKKVAQLEETKQAKPRGRPRKSKVEE